MKQPNPKHQLRYLFVGSLTILFAGMGLFPILPLYAAEFGATQTSIGVYFALVYLANASASLVAGWLAARMPLKGLFVAATALGLPGFVLLAHATAYWQVVLLTALLWFSGGMAMALINAFTAIHADRQHRGASFSLMSLAYPLGAIFGGTAVGQLVTWRGYTFMFYVLAVVWTILPLLGLLLASAPGDRRRPARANRLVRAPASRSATFGMAYFLVLGVALLSAVAINVTRLGMSLSMHALDYTPGAIASLSPVGGLVAIPVILTLGSLSDRFGRHRLLMVTNLLSAMGALTLVVAVDLWHFWIAAILMMVALSANSALANALATDILAASDHNRGLALMHTVGSAAGILSFLGTGFIMENLGQTLLYLTTAGLALIAVVQLWRLRRPATQAQPAWQDDGWVQAGEGKRATSAMLDAEGADRPRTAATPRPATTPC